MGAGPRNSNLRNVVLLALKACTTRSLMAQNTQSPPKMYRRQLSANGTYGSTWCKTSLKQDRWTPQSAWSWLELTWCRVSDEEENHQIQDRAFSSRKYIGESHGRIPEHRVACRLDQSPSTFESLENDRYHRLNPFIQTWKSIFTRGIFQARPSTFRSGLWTGFAKYYFFSGSQLPELQNKLCSSCELKVFIFNKTRDNMKADSLCGTTMLYWLKSTWTSLPRPAYSLSTFHTFSSIE